MYLQDGFGAHHVAGGALDDYDVAQLIGGRDADVGVVVFHHLAVVVAALPDDEAVQVCGDEHVLSDGHELEKGVLGSLTVFVAPADHDDVQLAGASPFTSPFSKL